MDAIVSVMCCAYNQEKYIERCLNGIVNQKTTFPFEVIVHDDASTDATPTIIRAYEEKYPDIIKGVYQKTNQFSIHPKRIQTFVYPLMSGKYVAFCEGDDFWCDSEKLQKQFETMEEHPECTICVHRVEEICEDGSRTGHYRQTLCFQPGIIDGDKYIEELFSTSKNLFQTSSYFIKKEILFSIPQRMNEAFFVGDIPMLLWAAWNGNIFFMNDICSCYRVMSEGSTNQMLDNMDYAILRTESSIEGNLAFNLETDRKYWEFMKKDICRKKAQLYFGHKIVCNKEERREIFAELGVIEILIASIKFTKVGNKLRNFRRRIRARFVNIH